MTVAAVLSPDTVNSWRRPPGMVGTCVTRYSVTNISLCQDRSTVSLVTSPTVRSFGGDTGGKKKENQKKNSNALNHRGSTTESKCKLQNHIWLWCEDLPKKVNKVQTMANPHTKNLFSTRRNSFSKDEGRVKFENGRKLHNSGFAFKSS